RLRIQYDIKISQVDESEDEGGTRADYCNKFSVHYEFYCKGSSTNTEITTKFCPFYKKSCKEHLERFVEVFHTIPAEPFSKSVSLSNVPSESGNKGDNFPDLDSRKLVHHQFRFRRPCTADCDQRIFPHCTQSCKCDYAYPSVQKFCNPPPLPLFLNTCRLWYAGCPKYERYHYASQFIYSKAEKGKRIRKSRRSPRNSFNSMFGVFSDIHAFQHNEEDIWPKVRPLNSITLLFLTYDSESCALPSQNERSVCVLSRSPGYAARNIPVVPSDSVFANALQQYGSFTDSQGILHRPHSTSPFTKPGLWEPNPNNPHNRDHSNKFYYRPESFNADWLNGQLAWGAHFAVPAVGVGGTDGFSALYFPNAGSFLNIPDDYD
uniref:Isthmin-1 n=1 Tax=Angiostrongylus cantonensis TaxID=6313 RepID=A0A0K0DMF3_ANGCA